VPPRNASRRRTPARWLGAVGGPLLLVSAALAGGVAGCSSSHDPAMTEGSMPAMTMPADASIDDEMGGAMGDQGGAHVPLESVQLPTQDQVTSAWSARPEYVKALPAAWQEAYAYALARPDVLQWLPCYCGCVAMDHRSNLDCFFQRREVAGTFDYEEHASYCDICVQTANLASAMLRDGSTIVQIRAAVDDQFGGRAPGTNTPLPPA
jgi:Protein of unknown function with PCYCGC motif